MTLLNSVIFKQNKKKTYMVEYFILNRNIFRQLFRIFYQKRNYKKNTNNEKSNPIEFELKPGMKQKLRYTSVANHKGLIL